MMIASICCRKSAIVMYRAAIMNGKAKVPVKSPIRNRQNRLVVIIAAVVRPSDMSIVLAVCFL
ncbi:hypothetical protein D3C78_1155920 [compost metagenome]